MQSQDSFITRIICEWAVAFGDKEVFISANAGGGRKHSVTACTLIYQCGCHRNLVSVGPNLGFNFFWTPTDVTTEFVDSEWDFQEGFFEGQCFVPSDTPRITGVELQSPLYQQCLIHLVRVSIGFFFFLFFFFFLGISYLSSQ